MPNWPPATEGLYQQEEAQVIAMEKLPFLFFIISLLEV
jgi:hypothetical protein